MIDKQSWMQEWVRRLRERFGDRLLFCGLQGSYRRGEATERSDFDVVTILEGLTPADLDVYRHALAGMPEAEKACGFICGREEFAAWPKSELFQFVLDTEPHWGSLDGLLPPLTDADARDGLRQQAANLYHMACHMRLYAPRDAQEDGLRAAYKAVFFALQLADYLRSGEYTLSRQALAARLLGSEKALLEAGLDFLAALERYGAEELSRMLLVWCAGVLRECHARD